MGGRSVPWIPRPKLIPEWDGMYGASGDAHLRSEVSGACRGLSFVLEALWRSGRVYIYRHLRAELLQLARVVFFGRHAAADGVQRIQDRRSSPEIEMKFPP